MDPAALCRSCSHYFVTHEPARPHGCRAFGFSSAEVPAAVVVRESEQECGLYEPKDGQRRPQPPRDPGATYA